MPIGLCVLDVHLLEIIIRIIFQFLFGLLRPLIVLALFLGVRIRNMILIVIVVSNLFINGLKLENMHYEI